MDHPFDSATDKPSVLGPTLVFKGELHSNEDLLIRGRVEGSIRHMSDLRIGEEGSVKGDIEAKYITVEGRIEGDLRATGSVTIQKTATVVGNVYAPRVSVIDGAHFKGVIDMDVAEETAQPASPSVSQSLATPDRELARKTAVGGN